jgi:hypothetical protein
MRWHCDTGVPTWDGPSPGGVDGAQAAMRNRQKAIAILLEETMSFLSKILHSR